MSHRFSSKHSTYSFLFYSSVQMIASLSFLHILDYSISRWGSSPVPSKWPGGILHILIKIRQNWPCSSYGPTLLSQISRHLGVGMKRGEPEPRNICFEGSKLFRGKYLTSLTPTLSLVRRSYAGRESWGWILQSSYSMEKQDEEVLEQVDSFPQSCVCVCEFRIWFVHLTQISHS